MKKIPVFVLILLSIGAYAQPTLIASTNTAVIGDNFTELICDSTGVLPGMAGPGITWDFSALTVTDSQSCHFVACASTPYCDSFAGSSLALIYETSLEYEYYQSDTNVFATSGLYVPSLGYIYYSPAYKTLKYPCAYGSSYRDTAIGYVSPPSVYTIYRDSVTIDAYGTLILPSGTYTNVLRQYNLSYVFDSFPGMAPANQITERYYTWFTPDFHFNLLGMRMDSLSGADSFTVGYVSYTKYGPTVSEGLAGANARDMSIELGPNPATDILNIKLLSTPSYGATITITDIAGRVVGRIDAGPIDKAAANIQYSVADLANGFYFVRVSDGSISVTRKVVVSH